jgi:hydrogenase maturation protease
MKWLLIGYGSALHEDDRFGRLVAERVRTAIDSGLADVLMATQLLPEMAEPIAGARGVIFVDAAADIPPGDLVCRRLAVPDGSNSGSAPAFSHQCTPATLLASAQELYGRSPAGWLCLVGGERFGLGETLSPRVEQAVGPAVTWILDRIAAG